MSSLTPPPEDRGAIRLIATMSEKQFATFLTEVRDSPPSSSFGPSVNRLLALMQDFKPEDIYSLLSATVSMTSVMQLRNLGPEQFVESILNGMADTEDGQLTAQEIKVVWSRLPSLLSLKSGVGMVSKVYSVYADHDRIYRDSRILTDIRPVFTGSPDEDPSQFVLIHMLKIVFQQDGATKESFFAMDSADIEGLGEVLDRARAKSSTLKKLLKEKNLTEFEVS